MHSSKWLRIGLILVIVIAGLTIVWSFLTRRQARTELPESRILSPEVSRRSTQFEYVERKRGRTVFKVFAKTSTETVDRVHTLKNLNVVYYNETGQPADTIAGQEAVYRVEEKKIAFSGDTQIVLADGTEVFSDRVEIDLERQRVTIGEAFRFRKDQIHGTGENLTYEIARKSMRVDNGLRLTMPTESGEAHASASQAHYRLSIRVAELIGEASVSRRQMRIEGDKIVLFFNETDQIQKLIAAGNSLLESQSAQFSGQQIHIFWRPETGALEHVGVKGDGNRRAVYQDESSGKDARLEADRISVAPGEKGDGDETLPLERFSGEGTVQFRSPSIGIEHALGETMTGEFWEGGARLRNLHLTRNVSVLRIRPNTAGKITEEVRCAAFEMQFDPDEIIETATARGNVNVTVRFPEGLRHLRARRTVRAVYQDGLPQHVLATGNCFLEDIMPSEQNELWASTIEARYDEGLLAKVRAEGGVRARSIAEDTRQTASRVLTAIYSEGELVEVRQSGAFRYWEGEPAAVTLSGEEGRFNPATGHLSVGGEKPPVLELRDQEGTPVRTLSERFELDRRSRSVLARGQVRTIIPGSGGSTVITSEQMEADPETGWVEYSGSPRITQPLSSITGSTVRYNRSREEMIVEGHVQSVMTHGNGEGARLYSIDADGLRYERSRERVLYERNVEVKTEDLTVNAPFVELAFDNSDSKELSRLIAWGGVHMTGRDRQAAGEHAEHYPADEKVILTGTPAEVIEPNKAKATGRQLTFFLNEERLLIEDSPGPAP